MPTVVSVYLEALPESNTVRVWRDETTEPLNVVLDLGGTAVNGQDYGPTPAAVVFADGAFSADVTFTPLADGVYGES